MTRAGLAAVFALCLILPSSAAASPSPSDVMLAQLNQARQAHGLAPLRQSSSLQRTARGYASTMLRRNYFGHQSRIQASGRFHLLGEILALHRGRRAAISATVRQWLHSSVHRSVILSPRFRYAGAGISRGRFLGHRSTTWVVHFGR